MQPTDITDPQYFHKVVDCQWACPAHTPVPEYIRLIAQRRYTDAFMINWDSNVFPGILGRTCDRPCEPACRRTRVEEKPVAICRLKRVAADYRGDISHLLPKIPERKNGKRIALIGAGPASLTVARDLLPLGYQCVLFEKDAKGGGLMRTNIPAFRLPVAVLDDEVDRILDMGVERRFGEEITSLKALLAEGYDAVFIGTGAPRGKDLEIPGRREAAANIHIGTDFLKSVAFQHTTSIGRRVVVIGGGNTAMDCCRTALRLGAESVTVTVRSPRADMKASEWEIEDTLSEGIPILDNHSPKEFVVENGRLTAVVFEKMRAEYDGTGRRKLIPTGEPPVVLDCDDVLMAIGQENAFPYIERDIGLAFDDNGMPVVDAQTFGSTLPGVYFGGDAAWGPENIIWAVEHGHQAAISIDLQCQGRPLSDRPPPRTNLLSQKMGIHEWSYDNDISAERRFPVPHADHAVALKSLTVEAELGYDERLAYEEAMRCLNCDIQTVFTPPKCIECDACTDICPVDCINFIDNGEETDLRARLRVPAMNLEQSLYVSPPLKTGRVMVKDEDVCLHCGLCAERCPTGAWDMQKYIYWTPWPIAIECTQMPSDPIYNDFVLRFANVNGSGSASANLLCAKALFRMGIGVSPKNIFPSNIQGMPTWYEIRVSEAGHAARREGVDVMVAMNPQTYRQDTADVTPGGALIYDSTWERDFGRSDITVIGIPIARLCAEAYEDLRQRQLFKNIVYLGALTRLIEIDAEIIEGLIAAQFRGKDKLIEMNLGALAMGRDYVRDHVDVELPVAARKAGRMRGKILISGNEAAALGALYAGATVAAWYPITPSTSLAEAFEQHAARLRRDENGTVRAAVIQAEDELAAIGIAIGANWNGARAFTATSGPGISLMSEFIGLAYFAEIPLVLFDIQRGGPSTGMPTRTQQSDVLACAYASHGDTKHVLLFPADPGECFTMAADAFDLADRLQTPVIVLSDLDIGMNDWVVDELTWDDARKADRGKLLDAEALERVASFARYRDVDGDAIPYRTIPGTHPSKGAFFTRGTSHTDTGAYTEDGEIHAANLARIERKLATAAGLVPKPVIRDLSARSRLGVINFGSTDPAVREALAELASEGRGLNHMRLTAFPFTEEVAAFVARHDYLFVVEQNRDAQMRHLLIAEAGIAAEKLVPVTNYDGMPLTADFVKQAILETLEQERKVAASCAPPITAASQA